MRYGEEDNYQGYEKKDYEFVKIFPLMHFQNLPR